MTSIFLNIVGLSTAFILISMQLRYDLSYDKCRLRLVLLQIVGIITL